METLAHPDQPGISAYPASVLTLILIVDLAITALHSHQEWKGAGAPLWRNFGAIVGLDVPDAFGFSVFTVGLTLTLWVVGFIAIAGGPLIGAAHPCLVTGALGLLIGARVSDTIVSHVLLHAIGYRPNPGLSSTALYILEAIFLAFVFKGTLLAFPGCAAAGLALGTLMFLAVLPLLWLARLIFASRIRPVWVRWRPIPQWAATKP